MSTPALRVDELLRHGQWLYRLARDLVRDDDLAHDLVQETWLIAMRSAPPRDEKLQPWLRGVVRNLARMSVRSAVRRRGREHACVDQDGFTPSPGDALERLEAELLLSTEVRRLDEPYRTTLLLLYVEGLSSADVARRLHISDGTVRWRHQHALAQLRRGMAESDPQRRRLRALLWPIGASAVVQGGIELLRSKALWVALAALAVALTPWRGSAPAARQQSPVALAMIQGGALDAPEPAPPGGAPAALPAAAGELLVVVTDRAGAPIAAASASIDGLIVGHTAGDGHVVVAAEPALALPEAGTIAIDAAGYQPAAAGFRLGETTHVRLAELEAAPAEPPAARLDQPLAPGRAKDTPAPAEATAASPRPAAAPPSARPPRRPPCSPGASRAETLNRIRKELSMMRRNGSPFAMVAAVVAALHQAGCAVDDGGPAAGQQQEAAVDGDQSSGDRGDDHPGDGGDDGGDGGDDHPGDDGGDDGGDGGETCPVDPCEGTSGTDLYVVSDCETLYPIEAEIDLTCAGARERCQELAAEEPDRSIRCEWGHAGEIFRHDVDPEQYCDFFGPPPPTEGPCPDTRCDIPCGDGGPGTYRGFYCGPDGQPFIETEDINCQTALGNCALNAALNPDKDIVCEFNGQEIFRREVTEGACVAEHGEPTDDCDLPLPDLCEGNHPCVSEGTSRYEGSFCDGRWFIRSRNIACQEALGNCILNASLDLTRSIRCQWNSQEIYRNEVEDGECQEFDPVCEAAAP